MSGPEGRERQRNSFVLWQIAGKPLAIEISRDVMDRMMLEALGGLGRLARGRGAEVGGILLGAAEREGARRLVRVEDFLSIPCEHAYGPSYVLSASDKQRLVEALEQFRRVPERRIYAVGYWRSHTRGALALSPEDLELLALHFSHPYDIALLIEPRGTGPGLAGVFFWEGGRIRAEAPCQTFEFGSGVPKPVSGETSNAAAGQAVAGPAEGEPQASSKPRGRFVAPAASETHGAQAPSRRSRRRVLLAIGLLILALGGAGFVWFARGNMPLPGQAAQDPFALGLRGREEAGHLHLSWDREAPAVKLADRARLTIADGDQLRVLELSREQLRSGSVIYQPSNNRVSVRLELLWGQCGLSEASSFDLAQAGGQGRAR